MKIDPGNEIISHMRPKKKAEGTHPVADEFGKILKESIQSAPASKSGIQKTWNVQGIPEIQLSTSPEERDLLINRLDGLLDVMAEYSQKLGNIQLGSEEIYPLVDKMKTERESLTQVLNSLPDGDGLKEILNQALIITSLETIKYDRGDYLPEK